MISANQILFKRSANQAYPVMKTLVNHVTVLVTLKNVYMLKKLMKKEVHLIFLEILKVAEFAKLALEIQKEIIVKNVNQDFSELMMHQKLSRVNVSPKNCKIKLNRLVKG